MATIEAKSLQQLKEAVKQELANRGGGGKDVNVDITIDFSLMGVGRGRPISDSAKRLIIEAVTGEALSEIDERFDQLDLTKLGTQTVSLKNIGSALGLTTKGSGNAVGRYFEYRVYEEIKAQCPSDATVTENVGEGGMSQEHLRSFMSQAGFENLLYPNQVAAIRAAAENAVKAIYQDTLKDQKNILLWALAGSSPEGDIAVAFGDTKITFELKYYKDVDSIKWFSLSDSGGLSNFPKLFSVAMFEARDSVKGVWDTPNRKGLDRQTWVNNLQTIGLSHYVRRILKPASGAQSNKSLLQYLVSKAGSAGKFGDTTLANKKIIIGSTALKHRYHVTCTLSDLFDAVKNKDLTLSQEAKAMVFKQQEDRLATFSINADKLARNASKSNEAGLDPPTWTSTFDLYLTEKFLQIQ